MDVPVDIAMPPSGYAPFRGAGDIAIFSNVIAANPATMTAIASNPDILTDARAELAMIGVVPA